MSRATGRSPFMKRAFLLAVLAAVVLPATAGACSCAGLGDPREELAESDAAMFGKVVGRRVVERRQFGPIVRYRVRVLRDYKDNLGRHIRFDTITQSSACGIDLARGERFGTLLHRFSGEWSVGSCTLRSRAHLEAGAAPLPKPSGEPPATLLIAGAFGDARLAGFDAAGEIVAYGRGPGDALAVDVCPGGMTSIEAVSGERGLTLATRSLTDLGVPRSVARLPSQFPRAIECRSPDGSRAAALLGNRVVRITDGRTTDLGRVNGGRALLADGRVWTQNRTIDVDTGRTRPFGPLQKATSILALSPDGSTLAAGGRHRLTLVDAKTARVIESNPRPAFDATWLTDDALFALGFDGARFYDSELAVRGRARNPLGPFTADAGQLVTVQEDRLVRLDTRGRRVGDPVPIFTTAVQALCAARSSGAAAAPAASRRASRGA